MLKRFWRDEVSDEHLSCNDVAPFLTALFDGEVGPQDAAHARAHLLACERCARLWLHWNQARSLLRNDTVMAPPPNMMWRVLMAVRMSGTQSKAQTSASHAQPSLRPTHAEHVEVPRSLSHDILSRTSGAKARPGSVGHRNASPSSGSAPRHYRVLRMPGLAVPAMAVMLMVLSHQTQFTPLPLQVSVAPPTAIARVHSVVSPQSAGVTTPRGRIASALWAVPAVVVSRAAAPIAAVEAPVEPQRANLEPAEVRHVALRSLQSEGSDSENDGSLASPRSGVSETRSAVPVEALQRAQGSPRAAPVMAAVYTPAPRPLWTMSTARVLSRRATAVQATYGGSFSGVHASLIMARPEEAVADPPTNVQAAPDAAGTSFDATDDLKRFADVASDVDNYRSLLAADKTTDDNSDSTG